jgi:hypothetical protein
MDLVAYFFEREDASRVADALGGDLRRGRFQGEDDDEDHPWMVVLRDVDQAVVDELLSEHDGWLEPETNDSPTTPPPLPDAPKRFKN